MADNSFTSHTTKDAITAAVASNTFTSRADTAAAKAKADAISSGLAANSFTSRSSKASIIAKGLAANSRTTNHNPPPNMAQGLAGPAEEPAMPTTTPTANPNKTKMLNHSKVNPLEQFASVTPLWTMSCLTPNEYNNPTEYRKHPELSQVILSSAGRYDSGRVQTLHGIPEFFVNNFKATSVIAPNVKIGNTVAVKYELEIYEPYSMGLFLHSLQVAAKKAGYNNHLVAPYVFKLEFKGYNDAGDSIPTNIDPKFFVMRFNKVGFNVTESGSKYSIEAVPFNHDAFRDAVLMVQTDITLVAPKAGTVEEMISGGPESLKAALNSIEKQKVEQKRREIPNEYDIRFPAVAHTPQQPTIQSDKGATIDPNKQSKQVVTGELNSTSTVAAGSNKIGKEIFGFTTADGGAFTFIKEDFQKNKDTGEYEKDNLTIDPAARSFHFAQGQSIITVINEIIKNSSYPHKARKAATNGFITYFKIDVQIEILEEDKLANDRARKFIFNIIPYSVHESIDMSPTAIPGGYDMIKDAIAKEYNYIYTGANTDILDFDIQINNLFYMNRSPSSENNNANTTNPGQGGTAEKIEPGAEMQKGNTVVSDTYLPRSSAGDDQKAAREQHSGPGFTSVEAQVADNFHRSFIEGASADLVNLNLKILGDPYWLADSGLANHSEAILAPAQSTASEAMNYEAGDIFAYITFRTPIDVSSAPGLYEFRGSNESAFGGIYRITVCESEFENGLFTQNLSGVRMVGQPIDFESGKASGSRGNTESVILGTPIAESSSTTDEKKPGPYDQGSEQ